MIIKLSCFMIFKILMFRFNHINLSRDNLRMRRTTSRYITYFLIINIYFNCRSVRHSRSVCHVSSQGTRVSYATCCRCAMLCISVSTSQHHCAPVRSLVTHVLPVPWLLITILSGMTVSMS